MVTTHTIKTLTEKEKINTQDSFIIGRLAEDHELTEYVMSAEDPEKSVSMVRYNGIDSVIFHVLPLSNEPNVIREKLNKNPVQPYMAFDNRNKNALDKLKYTEAIDKVSFLRKNLAGKLILFRPKVNIDSQKNKTHFNFDIVLTEDEKNMANRYYPIPEVGSISSHRAFEKKLIDKLPFALNAYNHAMDRPELIVCNRHIYYIEKADAIRRYEVTPFSYAIDHPEHVKVMPLPEDWNIMQKCVSKGISFISDTYRDTLLEKVKKEGKYVAQNKVASANATVKASETVRPKVTPQIPPRQKENETMQNTFTEAIDNYKMPVPESQFLDWVNYLANKKSLIYSADDIFNFHTSLKTSSLAILGGMSGTGKSRLARLYAEALNLKEGETFLKVAISPSYTEPSDLLGFYNPQTGLYTESETGLVSFLKNAQDNPDKLYMVLFDEMNLGQVEYYFSDFISLLEEEPEQRTLQLVGKGVLCHQAHYQNGIKIGRNVLFVGTANFDETTKDFSNRMLDRSNVILLEKQGFRVAKENEAARVNSIEEYSRMEQREIHEFEGISSYDFFSWVTVERGLAALNDNELLILDKLHDAISEYDSQTGVSFRIGKAIGFYLDNIATDEDGTPLLARDLAFDYQIKQRILTKVRGHRDQIENLVGYFGEDDKWVHSQLGNILHDNEDGLSFSKSRTYLEQKARELMRNGYTL
ncbi:McrB family protein [Bacillus bombysepticus]|uniref:McrB family protein n=1 Tax=Bacillus bombysepticus TaxID=658666 RepID=UPI003017EA11